MEVFDAVRTVLAVRGFADRPIADGVVDRILDAARLTASAKNAQPWHFIVVREPARIAELAGHTRTGPYVATAPLAGPARQVGKGSKHRKARGELVHAEEFGRPY